MAASPIAHAYDYGQVPQTEGTHTMRIPMVDSDLVPVLPDVEITIDAATKLCSARTRRARFAP